MAFRVERICFRCAVQEIWLAKKAMQCSLAFHYYDDDGCVEGRVEFSVLLERGRIATYLHCALWNQVIVFAREQFNARCEACESGRNSSRSKAFKQTKSRNNNALGPYDGSSIQVARSLARLLVGILILFDF